MLSAARSQTSPRARSGAGAGVNLRVLIRKDFQSKRRRVVAASRRVRRASWECNAMLFTLCFRKVFVFGGRQKAVDFAGAGHFDFEHPTLAVWIVIDLLRLVIQRLIDLGNLARD